MFSYGFFGFRQVRLLPPVRCRLMKSLASSVHACEADHLARCFGGGPYPRFLDFLRGLPCICADDSGWSRRASAARSIAIAGLRISAWARVAAQQQRGELMPNEIYRITINLRVDDE